MKVQIYQVFLTIEGKKQKLTKAIARQFPVDQDSSYLRWSRSRRGEPAGAPPICKVRGSTIGYSGGWLLLFKSEVAGLVWMPPVYPQEGNVWHDNLEEIPTVIL